MNKKFEEYQKIFNGNISKLEEYVNIELKYFFELKYLHSQCLDSLLFNLYDSCILTTNHLLERMIKLSLIKKFTIKLIPWDDELYNVKIKEVIDKYDSKDLHNTLELAKKEELIDNEEFNLLIDFKNKIRNSYSHAQIEKIIQNQPDFQSGIISHIESKKFKQIHITTLSPQLSQYYQYLNSQSIAFEYFINVRNVLLNLEEKIKLIDINT